MARTIWQGSIEFGLVTVPVGLYSATQEHTIHFHQFVRGTSDRVRYRRINERTEAEVDYDDIVKGRHLGGGEYVLVEPEELDAIGPGRSRSITISAFVDLDEIDPIHFNKTYWLAPAEPEHSRVYGLLHSAMAKTNRAGIATFVMRGKEYLAAIRAEESVLALETMYFADEIRDPQRELPGLPDTSDLGRKELEMAETLIDSMSGPWRPEDYRDTYTERVEQLLEDKRQGREVVGEAQPPEPIGVVNLVDALERSVRRAGGRGRDRGEPDVGDMTKSQLTAMARELGIKGRSKMDRSGLIAAIEEHSPAAQRRAS